jgi:hypothetical protein
LKAPFDWSKQSRLAADCSGSSLCGEGLLEVSLKAKAIAHLRRWLDRREQAYITAPIDSAFRSLLDRLMVLSSAASRA